MSSHDDIEAPEAKIARLETLLEIRQERHDSKIRELELKNAHLKLDVGLSAIRLQERDMRPPVSKYSSDLALQADVLQLRQDNLAVQAEVLQLRQDSAAKDEEVSHLRALLRNCQSNLTAIKQGFIALNKSYHETTEDLSTVVQDVDSVLEAETAFKKLQLNPSSPVADTAAGPSQPSQSASKSEKFTADTAAGTSQSSSSASKSEKNRADTAAGPPQPSSSASKSEKISADTAAGSPQPLRSVSEPEKVAASTGPASTTSSMPDYAQALKSPAEKRRLIPKARVPLEKSPLFARPPVTHADLAVKREAADQTRSEPDKRQISQKPNKAFRRGGSTRGKDARGRGDTRGQGSPRPDKGETSHEITSKRQSPLTTIQHLGSKSTQVAVPGSFEKREESRGTNVTAGSNQPPKNPEVKSSVTIPATQAGGDTVAEKDKNASSNPSRTPTARRRRERKMSDLQRAALQRLCMPLGSETDTDDEQEAQPKGVEPTVPATPRSPPPRDVENGPQSPHSTTDSHGGIDLSGAATADIKPAHSNVRKRMADEGQLGTSTSSKRLRNS